MRRFVRLEIPVRTFVRTTLLVLHRFVSSLMAELRRSSSLTPAKEVIARLDACPENAGHSCTWWVTCSSFPSQRFAFNGLTALSVCLSSLFLFGPFVVLMLYCFGFRPC